MSETIATYRALLRDYGVELMGEAMGWWAAGLDAERRAAVDETIECAGDIAEAVLDLLLVGPALGGDERR
ncbi:hypothetical protein AB0E56_11150 [Microbacterium sp. NPDC028030]|uniref:hypothetical protein n=1 Tax=Microbacterium sp. NPDC028030 TaxID=3155124 RepID=UPI0033F9239C